MRKRVIITLIFVGLLEVVKAQKGEKSIAVGPLISFPSGSFGPMRLPSYLKTGKGLEAIGQYNFSNKSSLLLQTGLAFYGLRAAYSPYTGNHLSIFSLKGGYKYQFGGSGFFTNALAGIDKYSTDSFSSLSLTLGGGKRFTVKDAYFIDAGIDYIFGDTDGRWNIKAVFSLFQRPKED